MKRALAALALVLAAACGPAFVPGSDVPGASSTSSPVVDVGAAPTASALPSAAPGPPASAPPPKPAASASAAPALRLPFGAGCKLPEPRKSDDACTTDADCGVSEPCHARACVAKAKSNPPGPTTTCTRNLVCDSADANRCGCFEGRCALIP
jgi:hypothetical protein